MIEATELELPFREILKITIQISSFCFVLCSQGFPRDPKTKNWVVKR